MSKNGKHNVILVRGIPFYPTVRGFRFSNQSGECKSNARVMGGCTCKSCDLLHAALPVIFVIL